MYEVILGRNETDKKKYGSDATILLGKHYVTMGKEKSLANPILLDVNRPHVILVDGKRGSGKSYSLGVMAEGIANLPKEVAQHLSVILFDTMGIYWTMKYPNYRDDKLLSSWKLEPKGLKPRVYVPIGMLETYKQREIPVDRGLAIKPVDVEIDDWCEIFGLDLLSSEGLLLERAVEAAKSKKNKRLSVEDIVVAINADKESNSEQKLIVSSRFKTVERWGLFDKNAPAFSKIIEAGKTIVIDISAYSEIPGGDKIKALVIGWVSHNALKSRLSARKAEEVKLIQEGGFIGSGVSAKSTAPLLWILIDEAHEFLPKTGSTLATPALVRLLREGRQPGISMVLATQQPGKIHTDVLTQSDIVLSHRLTAKVDVEALNEIMHSYLPFAIQKYLDSLPSVKGSAIVLDDTLEKIYPIRVRPRFSWHGGQDPNAIQGEIKKSVAKALKKS